MDTVTKDNGEVVIGERGGRVSRLKKEMYICHGVTKGEVWKGWNRKEEGRRTE